jgi:hypothetical protein
MPLPPFAGSTPLLPLPQSTCQTTEQPLYPPTCFVGHKELLLKSLLGCGHASGVGLEPGLQPRVLWPLQGATCGQV